MIGRDRRIQVVDSIINGLNYKNKKKTWFMSDRVATFTSNSMERRETE